MLAQSLETFSIILAALSFVYGVSEWRRSLIGQKKIEIAEQAIIAFREVEQAFSEIRSPLSFEGEGTSRKRRPGETESDTKLGQQAYVAIERLNARSKIFSEAQGLRYRFEAYFGTESLQPFDDMLSIRKAIISAAFKLEIHWKRQGGHFQMQEEFDQHLAKMHENEAIFWEGFGEPDPLKPRIDKMMTDIAEMCRSIIEPSPNLRIWCTRHWQRFKKFWLCR